MSRFLILSWDGGGNTPSAYNLGSRLLRRGHSVRMMGWPAMAAPAAATGLEFTRYASVPRWPSELRHEDGWDRIAVALFGAATEQDIVTEARDFGADVLIVDCMLTAGYAASLRLHVPAVSLVHPLYEPFVHRWGSAVLGTDVPALLRTSSCVLALQPPGFDNPTTLPQGTAYVGAILAPETPALDKRDETLIAAPGDPWVLLSLSTTLQGQREVLPGLLSALESMRLRVLLTLGGVLAPDSVDAPANVTVRASLPHQAVLPYMAALLTHAGMSTVAMALAAGVPSVCVPQGRDQPLNALRVAEVGAGLQVAPDATPDQVAQAVATVLSDSRYRSAAQTFSTRTAQLRNGEYATDLVVALGSRVAGNPRHEAATEDSPGRADLLKGTARG
jgi:UDP:flavonoid glycosyltransferase YjiC (YdhE family)